MAATNSPAAYPIHMTNAAEQPPSSWRLASHHVQTIRDVARGLEETNAGVCTRYLLDELEQRGPVAVDGESVQLHDVESFCDRFNVWAAVEVRTWTRQMARARRALARMRECGANEDANVLHVAYGYPDPIVRSWPETATDYLGAELISLVRYTATTEELRVRIVRAQAIATGAISQTGLANGGDLTELTKLVDLGRVREREAYLDRVITSGDAVRVAFGEFTDPIRPNEAKDAYAMRLREKSTEHAMQRTAFIAAARADADVMLTRASRCYHRAWLDCP